MQIKTLMVALVLFTFSRISMVDIRQAAAGDDLVRMDVSAYEQSRRPAAVFNHDLHNEAAQIKNCAVCHHVWKNGKLVLDESSEDISCSECHALISGPDNPMPLTNAFHTQCRSCHVKIGKGPLLCGECHRKE